jgi:hypothetical protein
MTRPIVMALLSSALFAAVPSAHTAADELVIETLLTGLNNPCGVAVRPSDSNDRYEIFVADSGAGRIIRVSSDEPNTASDVITGFPTAALAKSALAVGPIGLLFLDHNSLIVGASGSNGAQVLLFELSNQSESTTSDQAKQQVEILAGEPSRNHIFALARTRANDVVTDAIVLTCFADDHSGDVRKIPLRAETLAEPKPFAAADDVSAANVPAAITLGESGHPVVGWVGSLESPRDSRLIFYNPINGSRSIELSTELYDVLGLAYSPKSGNLYAVDAAWMNAAEGGVFRVDDASEPGTPQCKTVKIAELPRPTALAFGPDGALYISALGDVNGESKRDGKLFKITGDL